MELFTGKEVRIFVGEAIEKLKQEIFGFKDNDILTCEFDSWIEYFESKYLFDPIVLFENNIEQSIDETHVKTRNPWASRNSFEKEYYEIPGYSIIYKVPFDGYSELLKLRPSTYIMTRFEIEILNPPNGDSCGSISLRFSYTAQELKDKEDIKKYIEKEFNGKFESYRKMIGYVNQEIATYNSNIKSYALKFLEERKKKASDFAMVRSSLEIPLHLSASAPNIAPIPLKRITRKPVSKPLSRALDKEYSISDQDYMNIIHIIHNTCSSMEATTRTFSKSNEEELRDFIIATLGTHYVDMVTGETFRKIGKTDIHIVFENKAAFIGECKIWHGIKKFEEAIEQLYGYSTWKDIKTSLIIFNKENKDFSSIRDIVFTWIKNNAKKFEAVNSNVFLCTVHRVEENIDVQLAIALYDLYIK